MQANMGKGAVVPEAPRSLNVSNSQLGKKRKKHRAQYPEFENYTEYSNFAKYIFEKFQKRIFDAIYDEFYYIVGNDLLRVKPSGEFISLYPGADSSRVINAIDALNS